MLDFLLLFITEFLVSFIWGSVIGSVVWAIHDLLRHHNFIEMARWDYIGTLTVSIFSLYLLILLLRFVQHALLKDGRVLD